MYISYRIIHMLIDSPISYHDYYLILTQADDSTQEYDRVHHDQVSIL